jgi:glycosyltransferase involved in cell wall biosynthesis
MQKENNITKVFLIWWCYNHKIDFEEEKENNLEKYIELHWFLSPEKLKSLLKQTDLYIQASFHEGQCQAIMEAGLCWCKLLLSNIWAFKWTYWDLINYFDPNNEKDIAEKILNEIQNPKEQKIKEFIVENYSRERFKNQLEKFTNKI